MLRLQRLALAVSLLISLVASQPALAAGKSSKTPTPTPVNLSQAVTQSYNAGSGVQAGMIVELDAKNAKTVVPLSDADSKNLLGVVVPQGSTTIVLSPETAKQQQVLVATSGEYSVLVSNQNGPIKIGDYISISAIAGVGMKANGDQEEVLGKAAGNFTGTSNVLGTASLKNAGGQNVKVAIGRVSVDLYISHNPLFDKSAQYVPGFLAKIAVTVANKPVSAARIYLSMAVLLITAFFVANMLYSGIKSGMTAVGRNPLSKKSIVRSLVETVLAGIIIFVVGIFAVYLLLKL
jgi:hypothetical protein